MAADPKYANLSGIAYDQPDVYETTDLPEADQFHGDLDTEQFPEEDDSIEHLNISAREAFSKFKGKVLSAENIDFSDRLSRKPRTGYHVRSGEWELVGSGEQESPLQRYQRLKCEMKELLEEISALKEDDAKEMSKGNVVVHVENMLRELETLKLEKYLGPAVVSKLSDPQGVQIKKLLLSLERLSSGPAGGDSASTTSVSQTSPTDIRYEVKSNPSQTALNNAARVADLEARVAKLQALVSASPSTIKRLGGSGDKSLAETTHWIAGKVAMLQPGQVEVAETRITSLLGKLDQLAERSAAITGSTDQDNKISELYELVKTTEEMSLVIPAVLDRMLALEDLHKQGNDFSKSVSELESMQKVLASNYESYKELIKRLEENFASNMKTLKEDIDNLAARMKAIQAKK
uniref:Probable dynactin subunit 2 n=1 Tax=Riptortus pedestris TaxID=329032 RepID=R4WJP2_RIPPE|nr:probable dynactin subunit 2 [Riptortus pedestris]